MALSSENSTRANIRIEIKNDFTESMDEDMPEENGELSEGEVEDGEITDGNRSEVHKLETRNKISFTRTVAPSRSENQWLNGDGGFTTGVDIFGKDEQEKLQTRAQRFGLDPSECRTMTDEQLQHLYESLGLRDCDQADIRFETIHMYGTQEMSTQDVFGYFGKYGPASIEWISDMSCNVVWHDKVSAARAFIALSRPISGMPVTGKCNPFKGEGQEDSETRSINKGRSILLINTDEAMEDKENDDTPKYETAIHVSEINIPVPPGYWRLGYPHEKSKFILLRYASRTDKKPFRAERFSEYYKKYGNPNYGGMVGLISQSKKRKIKEINLEETPEVPEEPVVKGNPWGSLARNWHRDVQETVVPPRVVKSEQVVKLKIANNTGLSKSLLDRIGEGQKRSHSEDEDEDKSKKKLPRMRMYADEEEARIRKAKELKQIRVLEEIEQELTQKAKQQDLRSRLRNTDRKLNVPKPVYERRYSGSSSDSEEEIRVQQKSKVAVVIRKPHKPSVASTVWSRLDMEKEHQKNIRVKQEDSDSDKRNDSTDSESEDSDSDDEDYDRNLKNTISKTIGERPGFKTADLKARLGFQKNDHKSPLRIEINNDHYKKEKA